MIETGLKIIKTVLGDGVGAYEKLQKLKKPGKAILGRDMVTLYDGLNDLYSEDIEILGYVDSFIKWAKTGEEHTLENYTYSIRLHLFECYRILKNILETWDKHNKAVLQYVRLRDPELYDKYRRMFSYKGRFVFLLGSTVDQYQKYGIEFSDDPASFEKASDILCDGGTIEFPYVISIEQSFEPFDFSGRIDRDKFQIEFCKVDNLESLQKYREHLVSHMGLLDGVIKQLREIIVNNFVIEDLF